MGKDMDGAQEKWMGQRGERAVGLGRTMKPVDALQVVGVMRELLFDEESGFTLTGRKKQD